jgi:hypothetical protein
MAAQMLLGCMTMANAYPVIGLGRWGAGYCGVAVVVSGLAPAATHACLLSCAVVCGGLLVYDWIERDWHAEDVDSTSDPGS